ncbi:MAG: EFR1 family ferrodoxin [Proteobacteria bacterium]|nr:EFR1 family ferrodoxin [Pseudomonadota bacterium]
MNIQTISCVYFSPTGTTRAIVENIARGMQAGKIEMVDCTKRSQRDKHAFGSEIVILGVPVYYGRVPEEVAGLLATITAKQRPAVLVAVYGNRAYDDALKELYDIASTQGFIPVAAGAFIGEHSYSSSAYPIAQGRPDESDLQKARLFGANIREKLLNLESPEKANTITVPGHFPYVEPKTLLLIKEARKTTSYAPETDVTVCTHCGKCAEVCPTGAVPPGEPTMTDRWQCIICHACIKNCPSGARQMKNENFDAKIKWLYDICQPRKEPKWYL